MSAGDDTCVYAAWRGQHPLKDPVIVTRVTSWDGVEADVLACRSCPPSGFNAEAAVRGEQ